MANDLTDLIRDSLVEYHVKGHVFIFADIDAIIGTNDAIDIIRYCQHCYIGAVLKRRDNYGDWYVENWYDEIYGRNNYGEIPSCKQVRMKRALT